MIKKVEALNYKCLRYIRQELDEFNVLVGPNASGKTTFFDVISFMNDLINEGPLAAAEKRATDFKDLFWSRGGHKFELAIEVEVPEEYRMLLENKNYKFCRYEIEVGAQDKKQEFGILSETLWLLEHSYRQHRQPSLFPEPLRPPSSILFTKKYKRTRGQKKLVNKIHKGNDNFYSETGKWDHSFKLGPQKSALANLPEDETKFPVSTWFKKILQEGIQVLSLNSEVMRWPSPPGMPTRFRTDGSNLPWVIENLENNHPSQFKNWIKHIQSAIPEVEAIKTIERPEDRHRYLVIKNKNNFEIPSWLISDGTLRMLALTLLAYLPNIKDVFLVEEPENGIHPRAIQTVYQSLSSVYDGQILMATHSPIFLTLTDTNQLLCFAKDEKGAVDIILGSEHPALKQWKKEVTLGDLFASGILG